MMMILSMFVAFALRRFGVTSVLPRLVPLTRRASGKWRRPPPLNRFAIDRALQHVEGWGSATIPEND